MTFENLAKMVAADFKQTMDEFGFDTFEEMKQCYWWTSTDVKDEVKGILNILRNGETAIDAYIGEDENDVFLADDFISYRAFIRMVYKNLK